MPSHIRWALVAHALLRIAGGTSGILMGLYLAALSTHDARIGGGLVGTLGGVSFAAELLGSVPMGVASDRTHARWLMSAGAVVAAVAVLLLTFSRSPAFFFVGRALEGLGAAAIVPALLAYLADATEHQAAWRVRAMSYFELTLLAGLAFGGLFASQVFHALHARAFAVVALVYVVCAVILAITVRRSTVRQVPNPFTELRDVLRRTSLRRLAPAWLSINAIVGLWLGPMLPFLLTRHATSNQYLVGIYASAPTRVGWLLLAYAVVFGIGVIAWSFILPYLSLKVAMTISVAAMLPVCLTIFLLNHSTHASLATRWVLGVAIALLIMVESGFTPTALSWLAQALPIHAARGAAMGIYSLLLGIGAILGSVLAGVLGQSHFFDGLLFGTVLAAVIALVLIRRVPDETALRVRSA